MAMSIQEKNAQLLQKYFGKPNPLAEIEDIIPVSKTMESMNKSVSAMTVAAPVSVPKPVVIQTPKVVEKKPAPVVVSSEPPKRRGRPPKNLDVPMVMSNSEKERLSKLFRKSPPPVFENFYQAEFSDGITAMAFASLFDNKAKIINEGLNNMFHIVRIPFDESLEFAKKAVKFGVAPGRFYVYKNIVKEKKDKE